MKTFARIRQYSPGPGAYLFAGALFVRCLVLSRLTASPFLLPSQGDMHFYNDWALRILSGVPSDRFAFYGLPGYAYLLALFYKVWGYSPFFPAIVQAFLEAGTTLLIYHLTLRVWPSEGSSGSLNLGDESQSPTSPRLRIGVGLLAGAAWTLFVPAQACSVILMPTAWATFAFWFVVWRIVRRDASPAPLECLLLGLLIGVTATAVATILFLVPLLLAACFLKGTNEARSGRRLALAAAMLFLGLTTGTAPCWIHNYLIARDPVFLSAHGGINFWIGNNPEANGYPRFPPGLRAGQTAMLEDSIRGAETAAGQPLKRSQVSAFWSTKAWNYIAQNPFPWFRLLGLKFRNFWSAFQYDDLSIITNLREQRVLLPGLYFGVVAAFAIPGMLLAWRRAPRSRWIIAAVFLQCAALMSVFVTERYRLAAVPGLIVCAALGLFFFWQAMADQRLSSTTVFVLLVGASTMFAAWPQRDPSLWALDAYNSGWQALESGNLALAQNKLATAYAYVPTNPETNFALGNLSFAQGRVDEAKAKYRTTLGFDRNHKGALNNLGVIAEEEGDWTWAEIYFRAALKIDPRDGKTHYLLAQACLAQGNRNAASQEIEQALSLRPGQREFAELKERINQSGNSLSR